MVRIGILERFPAICEANEQQREWALYGYRSSSDLSGVRAQSSGYSDPTAKRGITLAKADDQLKQIRAVRKWIDERLPAADRKMLLLRWRGYDNWHMIGRLTGRTAWRCMQRWDAINREAEAYCRT